MVAPLGILTAARATSASTISFGYAVPEVSLDNGDFLDAFYLPKFDPSLGQLTAVTVEYDATVVSAASVGYEGPVGGTYSNVSATVSVFYVGPDSIFETASATAGPFSGSIGPHTGDDSIFVVNLPGSPVATQQFDAVDPANFSDFTGTGLTSYTFGFGGNGSVAGSTTNGVVYSYGDGRTASGNAEVTYSYTPVPEPTAVAGVATSVALATIRRSRRGKVSS